METKLSFTTKVVRDLLSHGFAVHLHNKDNIDGYGGWFSTDIGEEEFVVAMKHHMGFEILIHEYCHFLQWKYARKFWDDSSEYYDTLFDWVEDKNLEVSEENLNKSLHTILEIEHDCENRVLKLVKNNPIQDFDTDKYIRAVNAYLWSYHINKELRQRPKNPIYSPRVLEHMPNTFSTDLSFYLDARNLPSLSKNVLLAEYEQS
jgi:hypothetical protein